MKTALTVIIIFILFGLLAAGLQAVEIAEAGSKIITVPDDYSSIQAAIDNAHIGDRIVVESGTYNDSVLIDKAILS